MGNIIPSVQISIQIEPHLRLAERIAMASFQDLQNLLVDTLIICILPRRKVKSNRIYNFSCVTFLVRSTGRLYILDNLPLKHSFLLPHPLIFHLPGTSFSCYFWIWNMPTSEAAFPFIHNLSKLKVHCYTFSRKLLCILSV